MISAAGRVGRVSQPVLSLQPARARSIGPSAGLLEGPGGGVVFIFGLATFSYGPSDEVGRRLAAVQLVATRIATSQEVAAGFGVSGVTLWTWRRDFAAGGVLALVRARTGPRGPIKLTASLARRIAALDAAGATLLKIAALTGVSTATVRVALGRVAPPDQVPVEPDVDVEQPKGCESAEVADLVVLAPPEPRTAERVAARFGDLVEAPVVITEGAQLPLAGLLLALPALEMTGLLPVAAEVFPPMRKGFYGLRAVLLMGVFLALLREPRAEAATRIRPADLGRVLGLDRAPEVKTLRRKLAELAGQGKGAVLQAALGRHHATTRPDAVGFLYLDGHVRVYTGTRELPKTHIARMRIAGPATEETWVADADGDPVMVITAAPSKSLAAELARLLPDLRAIIGPDRACTVVFDRGGYSPAVFTEIVAAGFDVLTYFKGAWARSASEAFTTVDYQSPDGTAHTYELAERFIDLPVPARPQTGGQGAKPATTCRLRLIVRRSPGGHQTPILTNRTDLTAAQVAYRMAARWRQENYFKYAREHFALDALDSYADQPDDPTRMVPNPAKARAGDQVSDARAQLTAAQGGVADAIDDAGIRARQPGSGGKATVDPAAGQALTAAISDLAATKGTSRQTPSHLPLGQIRPGSRLLETETKLLTHAIRMSAYNTESALARLLRPHYARGDDEARALLREAFTLPGDLQITHDTIHVRLDPASAPRRSNALAALCVELTDTATRYPGTDLTVAYSIKGHPATK
jgi:transposase-like protein